ncbi:hypothetical protein R1sor_015605 [Riccia sorocarpa]|uniref:Ty3-gypsy retrotransposon protein n=1 Tax=Riccia sorocarpa TaxID=122646 RepID=A0ABD3HEI4_9MARC
MTIPPIAADEHMGEISKKDEEKVVGSCTWPPVDTMAEEKRRTKLMMKASRRDTCMHAIVSNSSHSHWANFQTRQLTHVRRRYTTQFPHSSSNLQCEWLMEASASQMASKISVMMMKVLTLEEEMRLINERVTVMEKKNLYKLLEIKMQGYQG